MFRWNPYEVVLEDGRILADDMDDNTLVYIHLSCDNGEADLMEKDEISGEFTLLRMVPPGKVNYYFSIAQPPLVSDATKSFTKTFINKRIIDIPGTNIFQNVI